MSDKTSSTVVQRKSSKLSAGQQRWAHYVKSMKQSASILVQASTRMLTNDDDDEYAPMDDGDFDDELGDFNVGPSFDGGKSFSLTPSINVDPFATSDSSGKTSNNLKESPKISATSPKEEKTLSSWKNSASSDNQKGNKGKVSNASASKDFPSKNSSKDQSNSSKDGRVTKKLRSASTDRRLTPAYPSNSQDSLSQCHSNRRRSLKTDIVMGFIHNNDNPVIPTSSIPRAHRSSDDLVTSFTSTQPSNVELDDISVYTGFTSNSMVTEVMSNRNTRNSVLSHTSAHGDSTSITSSIVRSHQSEVGISNAVSDVEVTGEYDPEQLSIANGRKRRRSHDFHSRIDTKSHSLSPEERESIWKKEGKCTKCGCITTHKKESFGHFKVFRRMVPQTVDGLSYKGYCLSCYDVPQLRELLSDPDIPSDLYRNDTLISSLLSLQALREEESPTLPIKEQFSDGLHRPLRLQICFAMTLLFMLGGVASLIVMLTSSSGTWKSITPTMVPSSAPSMFSPVTSPTSWDWTPSSEITSTVESFGYKIDLSADGDVLAVSSPKFEDGKGRFDVYLLLEGQSWRRIDPISGTPHIGTAINDFMGKGMTLSGDGLSIAVGSPGYENGLVQVYEINKGIPFLTTKGQPIYGPNPLCDFGHSVALSYDGSRLFVGAPNYAHSQTEVLGLVRAYDYDPTTQSWIQAGDDIMGDANGIQFGHSLVTNEKGDIVVIGSPLDSRIYSMAGSISYYKMDESNSWYLLTSSAYSGGKEKAKMGSILSSNENAQVILTNDNDNVSVEYENAGMIQILGLDEVNGVIGTVGLPISGTHEGARFGYDVDISGSGEIIVASSENNGNDAGSIQVLVFFQGLYEIFGSERLGLKLGTCNSFGNGPSVAVAAKKLRFAVGYECIMSDGLISSSTIHIFDYFAVSDDDMSGGNIV